VSDEPVEVRPLYEAWYREALVAEGIDPDDPFGHCPPEPDPATSTWEEMTAWRDCHRAVHAASDRALDTMIGRVVASGYLADGEARVLRRWWTKQRLEDPEA
jgi:hypothetical protein